MAQRDRFARNRKTATSRKRTLLLFSAIFGVAAVLWLNSFPSGAAQATVATLEGQSPASAKAPDAQTCEATRTQPTDAPWPSFEVASIKKHVSESGPVMRVMMGAGSDVSEFRALNVTVKMLIASAYCVRESQISAGPSWTNSDRFDIDAKVDDLSAVRLQKLPRPQQQTQRALLLRSLLADRFKLEITRGWKDGTVLALVIAKGGPKLKEVPPLDPITEPIPARQTRSERGGTPTLPAGSTMMMVNGSSVATLSANGQPITNLVDLLSVELGQKVIDETGLKGTYQYTLRFTPQGGMGGMPPMPKSETDDSNSDEPSIFTALQDQLGLRLETRKAQLDAITIDHIEQPSEN